MQRNVQRRIPPNERAFYAPKYATASRLLLDSVRTRKPKHKYYGILVTAVGVRWRIGRIHDRIPDHKQNRNAFSRQPLSDGNRRTGALDRCYAFRRSLRWCSLSLSGLNVTLRLHFSLRHSKEIDTMSSSPTTIFLSKVIPHPDSARRSARLAHVRPSHRTRQRPETFPRCSARRQEWTQALPPLSENHRPDSSCCNNFSRRSRSH